MDKKLIIFCIFALLTKAESYSKNETVIISSANPIEFWVANSERVLNGDFSINSDDFFSYGDSTAPAGTWSYSSPSWSIVLASNVTEPYLVRNFKSKQDYYRVTAKINLGGGGSDTDRFSVYLKGLDSNNTEVFSKKVIDYYIQGGKDFYINEVYLLPSGITKFGLNAIMELKNAGSSITCTAYYLYLDKLNLEAYNTKLVDSIYPVDFFQPFECDDVIKTQTKDATKIGDAIILRLIDQTTSYDIAGTTIGTDDYDFTFTPRNKGICNDVITANIVDTYAVQLGSLSMTRTTNGTTTTSSIFIGPVNIVRVKLHFFIALTIVAGTPNMQATLNLKYRGTIVYSTSLNRNTNGSQTVDIYIDSTNFGTSGFDEFYIVLTTGGGGTYNAQTAATIYKDNEYLAKSDCLEILEDQENTTLIQYSNYSDTSDLFFENISPAEVFYSRIPAIFFEENFPQEQEDLELSDDTIVTLWSKIEGKKLLDIGYVPFYMHKKIQLILMMDSITIEDIDYRLRDAYQITPSSSKRSALRKANVLLSQKDFIDRNLL